MLASSFPFPTDLLQTIHNIRIVAGILISNNNRFTDVVFEVTSVFQS